MHQTLPRPYPPEFRARAIALIHAGKQARQTALGYRTPIEYELLSKNDTVPAAG
ncbi:hypothetical protein ACWEBX_06325 [Streptomyces sp. NPDC005070]